MTPQLGLTMHQPDKTFPGYTLFAPLPGTSAYLIDMHGAVVHRWTLPYSPALYGYLLDNGNLLVGGETGRSPVTFGGAGGTLLELDWDSHIVWEHVDDRLHHDFCRMPNGHTMLLAWEQVPADMVRISRAVCLARSTTATSGVTCCARSPPTSAWCGNGMPMSTSIWPRTSSVP